MKSIDTASFAMSVLMLYIIGISSCGGESVAPDVTGEVSAEIVADAVPLDVVDTRYVPCPEGELTLEHAMMVMHNQICDRNNWHCGNGEQEDSPMCSCMCCSQEDPTEYSWFCHESMIADAY